MSVATAPLPAPTLLRRPRREYALGLLFSEDRSSVVLIRKNRPEWQAGLLNGVGGKVEAGETPLDALVREFREETGVRTSPDQWREFARMHGEDFVVHCFMAFDTGAWAAARTVTDESIVTPTISCLSPHLCVSNLTWLIPLALDDHFGREFIATIQYGEATGAGPRAT